MLILAELGREVSGYMRRSGSASQNWYLILAILGFVLFWSLIALWDRYRSRYQEFLLSRPKMLFQELCDAHQLSRGDKTLLLNAANSHQLEQPATVFVDPAILQHLSQGKSSEAKAYTKIRKRIFPGLGE